MATTTRMRKTTRYEVVMKTTSVNDSPDHTVVGTDGVASLIQGGVCDFQVSGTSDPTHVDITQLDSGGAAALGGDVAIASYIYIKHTGFTSSARTVTTTATLLVGLGGAFDAAGSTMGFTLQPGEAITLHGLSGGCNNLSEIYSASSSGAIWTRVIYF